MSAVRWFFLGVGSVIALQFVGCAVWVYGMSKPMRYPEKWR